MNIAKLVERVVRLHSERPAIYVGTRQVSTYNEFGQRVATLAGALRNKLGLKPGDRVALAMLNCPEFLEIQYACWWAGLTLVPTNARLHPKELAYILEDSGAKVCFCTAEIGEAFLPQASDFLENGRLICVSSDEFQHLLQADPIAVTELTGGETAWLGYTSGTTGRPKGAMLSHKSLMTTALRHYSMESVGPDDAKLYAAAMSHGAGAFGISYLLQGGRQIIPESKGFRPAEIYDLLSTFENVSMFGAPTMVMRLIDDPSLANAKIENLKTIIYGGGPMYVQDIKRAMAAIGNRFHQGYGLTEAPLTVSGLSKAMHGDVNHPRYDDHLGSVGVPFMGTEIVIRDEAGNPLPAGEVGEITIRGDVVMTGYLNRPEANAETLRDGWLYSGDVGLIDEEGFLTLKDRSKDLIISGGLNIYPREVEEALLTHPDVVEASVIGVPNREWGEETVAFVVTSEASQIGKDDLDTVCRDNLAGFKRPKRYEFVTELPKNNYGKVLKTDLRKAMEGVGEDA